MVRIRTSLEMSGRLAFAKINRGIGTAMRAQYGSTARVLHWLTVLLVIAVWAIAKFGEQLFDEGIDVLHKATAIGLGLHLWIGLVILIITALRLRWRVAKSSPPPESSQLSDWLISWTDPSARFAQYILYGLLLAVPMTGILLLLSEGKLLAAFGLVDLAPWTKLPREVAPTLWQLHVLLANLLVIVAIFHAVTAMLHHVVFGDRTIARMLPRLRKGFRDP